jgi:perosamine synthetase
VERKRRLADGYAKAFATINGVRFVGEPQGTSSNYWLNAIMLDGELASHRDELLGALNDAGFMSRPVWMLMHKLPMYQACPRMNLEVAERIEAQLINLPSSPGLVASS